MRDIYLIKTYDRNIVNINHGRQNETNSSVGMEESCYRI